MDYRRMRLRNKKSDEDLFNEATSGAQDLILELIGKGYPLDPQKIGRSGSRKNITKKDVQAYIKQADFHPDSGEEE
jgi:hypothetical protein